MGGLHLTCPSSKYVGGDLDVVAGCSCPSAGVVEYGGHTSLARCGGLYMSK